MNSLKLCLLEWGLAVAAILSLSSTPSLAAKKDGGDGGLVVNADEMSTDMKSRTTQLIGNVQIVFKGQHLSCDRANIYYQQKRIEAAGNVKLQSPTLYAEASSLIYLYEADSATLEDAFIQSGQVVFEGKHIEKTGPNSFVATKAQFTACDSCPPAWSFSGRKIEAELGGYAKIDRPVMRIGGIPIVMLPTLMVPLKSSRQSGLLVPEAEYSGGPAISESFFWAISRSQDLTVTGKYYEKRGTKALGEYRYVLAPNSKGSLSMGYIRDRAFTHEYGLAKNVDRWYSIYEHYYDLPDGYVQRASIHQASDLRYDRDFPDEIPGLGDPALESKLSLTKSTASQIFSIEANYYDNLLKEFPLSNNDDAVHRLPEIRYSIPYKRILESPVLFRFDSVYTNFARANYTYDDLSQSINCPGDSAGNPIKHCSPIGSKGEILRDGQFDPGVDKIRTGQRLDARSTLSLPFTMWKILEITPEITFREMQYRFETGEITLASESYSPSAAQRYIETGVSAKTSLSRVYGDLSDDQSSRIKHEIEPQISFSNIPWMRRPDHAFFGDFAGQRYSRINEPISDNDLYDKNRLQFDYDDRVFDKQIVEFAIANRFTRKRWKDGFPIYERIVHFRLSQSYDFNNAHSTRPQPWSEINGLLNVRVDNFETYTNASYNPYAHITNTSSRIKFFDARNNFVQASYERIYLVDADNVVTGKNQTENIGFGMGAHSKYVNLGGQIDYSAITSRVLSWGYVAEMKPPGNCWSIMLRHRQVIGARNPEFRFNFSFDFGGEGKKSLN